MPTDIPDTPQTREETYLAAANGQEVELPDPMTREEAYLYEIATKMQGGGGGGATVEPLSVTENGTYTAPSGKAYSPVTVAVPGPDTYHYDSFGLNSLTLLGDNNSYPTGTVIYIDGTHLKTLNSLALATGCPGYEEIVLTTPSYSVNCSSMLRNHTVKDGHGFSRLTLIGDLIIGNASLFLTGNRSLISISGGELDLSSVAPGSTFVQATSIIETIRFKKDTIKSDIGLLSPALTVESVVSAANGLDGTVSGQTFSLDSAVKAGLSSVMGTVTDGIFTQDASGTVTLTDFITNTKGWTLA